MRNINERMPGEDVIQVSVLTSSAEEGLQQVPVMTSDISVQKRAALGTAGNWEQHQLPLVEDQNLKKEPIQAWVCVH